MKRYLTLVMLALLLSIFGVSYAQTVTIGDGTGTTSYFPFYGFYSYGYTQQIYTQAQINTAGTISRIRFYYVSGSIGNNKDWTIYMGHTQKTEFNSNTDWEAPANLTQVFDGDVSPMLPAANNWMEIRLDTPFTYNNTDNLIIAVHQYTPGYSSMSWGGFTSGANTGIYYYSDGTNPNPASPPSANSRVSNINRIQLQLADYSAAPLAPELLAPANGAQVFDNQELRWALPSGSTDASGYDVYLNDTLVSSNQSGTTYTPTGLSPGTYTWYVQARNSAGVSPASDTWNFEYVNAVIIGDGTSANQNPFNAWYGYGRSIGLYTHAQVGQYGVITTLGWNASSVGSSAIPYKIYAMTTTEDAQTQMTWADFTTAATLVKDGTSTPHTFSTTGWHQFVLDIPFVYTGGNLLIGVEANYGGSGAGGYPYFYYTTGTAGSHQFWQQDGGAPTGNGNLNTNLPNLLMVISPLSADPVFSINPTGWDFGRTQINTTGSKTFTITNAGGGILSVNTVTPASTGFYSVTDITNMPGSLATGETASFTVNYSPTEVGNHYATFRVGHGNGLDDVLISGECYDPAISSFPYTENFDGTWSGTPAAPEAWTVINANSDSYTWRQSAQWLAPRSEPYVAHGMGNTNDWLITPPINLSGVNVKMKWWDRVESSSYPNSYKVFVSTTTPEIASFTTELTDITCTNIAWTERELNLSAYNGQTIYVAFYQYASAATFYAFGIDDFSLEELPTTPIFSMEPTEWDFGIKPINTTSSKTFTITNAGIGTLTVTGISPTSSGYFSVTDAPAWPVNLAAGESTNFNIEYTPTAAGTHSATFTITDGRATTNLTVDGECYDPTISTFPWTEGFTNATFPPAEWARYYGLLSEGTPTPSSSGWYRASNFAADASNPSARTNVYGSSWRYWLVTPPLAIPATGYQLDFDVALTTYSGGNPVDPSQQQDDRFIVLISDQPDMTGAQILREWNNTGSPFVYNSIATQGEYQAIDLSSHVGTRYIGFYVESTASGGDNYLYLDNVRVRETPAAPVFVHTPDTIDFGTIFANTTTANQDVTVINTAGGTLELPIANVSIIGADAAMFAFDPANLPFALTLGQPGIIPVRYQPTAAGTHTATLRMVYDGSNYDVALSGRAVGENALFESFESTAYPPVGWQTTWTRSTSYAMHGSASVYRYGSTSIQHLLSTPMLTIEDDSTFDFWIRCGNTNGIIEVLYSPDRVNWTPIGGNITFAAANTWYNHSIDLSTLAGNNYYLALRTGLVSAGYYADMFVGPNITPIMPDVPVLVSPADVSTFAPVRPTLTWNAGTGTEGIPLGYRVYLDTNNPPTTTVADVAATSYTFTHNLQADTEYFWTVEAYNAAGTSARATPFSFTTAPAGLIVVGNGALSNSTSSYPAVYGGWYKNAREQYIITAAELSAAGAQAGYLASIAFNVETPNSCAALPNFTIKMGTTTATEFANTSFIGGPTQEGLTQVFNAASYQPIAGWNTHSFDTPFNWDGTSNIVVQVSFDMQSNYSQNASTYYSTTSTYQAMYYRSDSYAWDTESTGTRSNNRPNMIMVQPPDAAPAAPTLTTPLDGAIDLPKGGFDLRWSPDIMNGGMPNNYAVFLATDPVDIYNQWYWETTNIHFNPVLEDSDYGFSFVYGQRYYWTVQAINDHGSAVVDPPFYFVIEADPTIYTYPWTENFDSVAAGEMPAQWTIISSPADRPWITSSGIGATSEPNAAAVYYHGSYPKDEWMITPPFSMQAGQDYRISFQVKGEGWGGVPELLAVCWGTEPTVASMTANTAIFDGELTNPNWSQIDLFFTPASTGNYYLGWHAKSPVNLDFIAVDDICVYEAWSADLEAVKLVGGPFGKVGNAIEQTVSVANVGTTAQSNYTVYIKDQSTDAVLGQLPVAETINSLETKVHTVSWTPATAGDISIYAEVVLAGDSNATNNTTAAVDVTIYQASSAMLPIGDADNLQMSSSYPFNVYYKDFVAETVYLASEVQATAGTINAVVYYNQFQVDLTVPVQIWMKNTDAANIADAWLPWDGYQLVFDGNIFCPEGTNQVHIPITPFTYTGGNLAIRTSKTWEDKWKQNCFWINTPDANYPNRTRYIYSDGVEGTLDHANPTGGSLVSNVPYTIFIMDPATLVNTLPAPVVNMTESTTGYEITWGLIPYAHSYKVYVSADPYNYAEEDIVVVYTNSYEMDNAAAKRFCKVTANTYRNNGRATQVLRNMLEANVTVVDENPIARDMKGNGYRRATP